MIAMLLAWAVLAAVCLAVGGLAVRLAGLPAWIHRDDDRLVAQAWVGLLVLASLALAVASFAPLGPWLLLVPLSLLAIPSLRSAIPRPEHPVILVAITLAMSYTASSAERLYDSALYHNQLIRWMADDGIVPGLGLLHYRLSFSSSWLAATALFDHGPLQWRAGRVVTGLALILVLYQYVILLARRERRPGDGLVLAALPPVMAVLFFETMIVSASPNLGTALAVVVASWLLWEGTSKLGLVFSAAAVPIKLLAAPILAATAGWFPVRWLFTAALLAAPLPLANYQASGCPLFPAEIACVDRPASVGAETAKMVRLETREWARHMGVPRVGRPAWKRWLSRSPSRHYIFFAALSLAFVAWKRAWNRVATASVLGIAYYLLGSPDLRFGIGFLGIGIGASGALLANRIPRLPTKLTVPGLCVLLTAGAMTGEYFSYRRNPDERLRLRPERILLPGTAYLYGHKAQPVLENGMWIYKPPGDNRCGALPKPCTPYPLAKGVHACPGGRGYCREIGP